VDARSHADDKAAETQLPAHGPLKPQEGDGSPGGENGRSALTICSVDISERSGPATTLRRLCYRTRTSIR
jgi:hypothetical protein